MVETMRRANGFPGTKEAWALLLSGRYLSTINLGIPVRSRTSFWPSDQFTRHKTDDRDIASALVVELGLVAGFIPPARHQRAAQSGHAGTRFIFQDCKRKISRAKKRMPFDSKPPRKCHTETLYSPNGVNSTASWPNC